MVVGIDNRPDYVGGNAAHDGFGGEDVPTKLDKAPDLQRTQGPAPRLFQFHVARALK